MRRVLLDDDTIEIEASVIADGLDLSLDELRRQMRAGRITSLSERGTGDDEGRHRLTFFSAHRRFRVVIDARGVIVQRSAIDFGEARLPPSMRRPGD